ncbi:MAG: hypothetical protein HYY61_00620 [Deltaproteobacteria bacterium]|nr:hypothetical protein [Deltaproteobacteria bacterium]
MKKMIFLPLFFILIAGLPLWAQQTVDPEKSEKMHDRLASKFKSDGSFVHLLTDVCGEDKMDTRPILSQELYNVLYRQDVISPNEVDRIVILNRPHKRLEEEQGFEIKEGRVILYIPPSATEEEYRDLILNRYIRTERVLVEGILRDLEKVQTKEALPPSTSSDSCSELTEVETLLTSVHLGTEEQRLETIEKLRGYETDPRVQKKLSSLVFDTSPRIRDKAISMLADGFERKLKGYERVYFDLIQMAQGKTRGNRERAIEALGYFRERSAIPAGEDSLVRSGLFTLLDLTTQSDPMLRKWGEAALIRLDRKLKTHAWQVTIRNVMDQKMGHEDPSFRKEAIETLAVLKGPTFFDTFLRHLKNISTPDMTKKEIISALPKVAEGIEFPLRVSVPQNVMDELILFLANDTFRKEAENSLFLFADNKAVSDDSKQAMLEKLKALPDTTQESVRYIIITLEGELKR